MQTIFPSAILEYWNHFIIMSDPKLQRADGCGIFMTLIVAVILISAFYFIQKALEPDVPKDVSSDINDQRLKKIKAYQGESDEFSSRIDFFHSERNSSIDSAMQGVVERYKTEAGRHSSSQK